MHSQHFLVREYNGDYMLKPIDPALAQALERFGILSGHFFHRVNAEHWTFYFMHCQMSAQHANIVAQQLGQELLAEMHVPEN